MKKITNTKYLQFMFVLIASSLLSVGHIFAYGGVLIDKSDFPIGYRGYSDIRTLSGSNRGDAGSDVGAFRLWCKYSHMSYDDPIVAPGVDNGAHLHMFWGNRTIDENSTPQSLTASSAESTCDGGGANKSAYWAPALVFDGKKPIEPSDLNTYYKSGYRAVPESAIGEIPDNLVMIAGDATSKTRQSPDIVEWHCNENYASDGLIPQNCDAGDTLGLDINFPQCWNGTSLDSSDHKSHLRYPGSSYWGDVPNPPGTQGSYGDGCTKENGYNNPIPVITMNIEWELPAGVTGDKLRLSSDAADAQPGASAHADFMEGWDRDIQKTFINECIKKHQSSTFDLCDGRVLNYNLSKVQEASPAASSPGSPGASTPTNPGSPTSPSTPTSGSSQPASSSAAAQEVNDGTVAEAPVPEAKVPNDTDEEVEGERVRLFSLLGTNLSDKESWLRSPWFLIGFPAIVSTGSVVALRRLNHKPGRK